MWIMSRSTIPPVVMALLVLTGTFAGIPALGLPSAGTDDPSSTRWPGALDGPAVETPSPLLWLKAGVFDPLADDKPLSLGLEGSSSRHVYLVQFVGPLSPDTGERLETLGAGVMGYVPDDGLVVGFERPSQVLAVSLWRDVRWLCPWQDGWKVDPWLEDARGTMELGVLAWDEGADLSKAIARAGGRVLVRQLDLYVVRVDASSVPDLAAIPGVNWVEPWGRPTFLMDMATKSVGARQRTDGALDPDGTAVWSYDNATDTFKGLTGRSVTVDITDTGVDGTHSAFNGRTERYTSLIPTQPIWSDPLGHGTHVAGIVLGDGSYRSTEDQFYHDNFDGKFVGMAPGAYMIAQSLYGPNETFTYRNLTKWSVQNGAQISQNSWGTYHSSVWGNYTIVSRDYDNSTRDADWTTPGNQSLLCVFAAGNEGIFGNNTLSVTASAKNVITVGSTGNGKNVTGKDEVWLHSSRGWTDDGRIKPDLVGPGDDVVSTWGIADSGSTGSLPPEAGDHSYITYGGTSMSAPVVSGSAALVMDYLISKQGQSEPSPAVVKSILLASADHLSTSEWPSREQGWGRVNVSRAIVETRDNNMEFVDQTTKFYNVGESQSYRYDVQPGNPLRVSLVWTDLPSEVFSGKMLINDLDLEVESPSGQVYKGNVFGGGKSITGGNADDTNNVEMVYIEDPEAGEWEVTVRASQLPPVWNGGNQDFAVAVVGNVNKKFVDIAAQNLSVRATDAAEGDVIPIVFDLANLGNLPAPAVPWVINIMNEFGSLHERLTQGFDDIEPRSGVRIYANWTAVRGEFTIKVIPNPLRTMAEESYQNNNASKEVFIKGFGVSGDVDQSVQDGLPGTDVEFTMEVTNEGNVPDLFILTRSEPPSGWNARLDATFLDIIPGGTKTAVLTVTVPQGLMAWEAAFVNVTVSSQGNDTHQVVLRTQTNVAEVFDLSLEMDVRSIDTAPGEEAPFEFTITNNGNAGDTYRVTHWQQSGPDDGVTFTLNRTTFATAVGETVHGGIVVALDAASATDLPAGETIAFIVKVTSAKNANVSRSVTGSVVIKHLPSAEIAPLDSDTLPVMPGEEKSLTFDVTNTGNGEDLLTPTATVPEGWEVRTSEPSVFLTQGETKTVQMWITVSLTATAGDHDVVLVIKSGEDVLTTKDLTFVVDWLPRVSVSLDGSHNRNLTQGQELTMEFRVTNSGNGPDFITVEFSGLSRGVEAEARPTFRDLAQDEIGTFIIAFTAANDAELLIGRYTVTFVYAEGVERESVQVNITIEQRTVEPPPNGNGNGGDDDEGFPIWLLGLIIGIVVAIVVGYFLFTSAQRRRSDSKMEEDFFKDSRSERATSEVLADEMASRRVPPPPPAAEVPPPAATEEEAWAEGGVEESEDTASPEVAPVAAPAAGGSCPECGNAMQPMGPGGGAYCPMCGHQEAA
ncbi:MAG: S8 family serine peptidase [Thermoplasmata archaeon]|nr:MAG: S8 family serine peptidase [Thermoplasmata archaeon]